MSPISLASSARISKVLMTPDWSDISAPSRSLLSWYSSIPLNSISSWESSSGKSASVFLAIKFHSCNYASFYYAVSQFYLTSRSEMPRNWQMLCTTSPARSISVVLTTMFPLEPTLKMRSRLFLNETKEILKASLCSSSSASRKFWLSHMQIWIKM